jgi:hypothetical protein
MKCMNSLIWILLFFIFPLIAFGKTELTILEDSPQQLYRPKIGPMLTMNFLTMDYSRKPWLKQGLREDYPEKFRGFSIGVMAEKAVPNHEHIFSVLVDGSFEYMPTYEIDLIELPNKNRFEVHTEFSHYNLSFNGGVLIRVYETGVKFGAGFGLNFMYASKKSFVTLDSITREEISNQTIKVIEYLPDRKTAEIQNAYNFSPNFLRIPIYTIFGYEFHGNKFSFFPFFRFNFSIFTQASYRGMDYTVSAYQVGATLMIPIKK